MNMKGIGQGMKKLCPRLKFFDNFYKYLTLRKGQPEGQGQVWVWWCEALMTRSIVCEYERNRSRNEEVMANVIVFWTDGRTDGRTDNAKSIPPPEISAGLKMNTPRKNSTQKPLYTVYVCKIGTQKCIELGNFCSCILH